MENCDSILAIKSDSISALNDTLAVMQARLAHGKVMQSMLGGLEPWQYAVGFIFTSLGIIFMWLYLANRSRRKNPNTPNKWSWKLFFSVDNVVTRVRTLLLSILTIYISFRFAEPLTQSNFSMFYAFGVGVGLDYFTDFIAGLNKKKIVDNQSPAPPANG